MRRSNIAFAERLRLRRSAWGERINAYPICEHPMRLRVVTLLVALCITASMVGAQGQPAQQPALTRTVLQQHALGVAGREGVQVMVELAAGGAAPRHTHPGEEFGYVLNGTATLDIAGQPLLTLKPGDSFFIPANTPHVARNPGTTSWKAISTYIVESGKPLATPAP
jgi:quercetin dioxygenase-like cupin family protein